jgi:uncharacterized protein (DUF2384 family)
MPTADPATAGRAARAFRHLVPELHDPASGRLDAKRIGAFFDVPLAALARLLGRPLATIHKTPGARPLQEDLAVFERIAAALLHLAGSPDALRMWMNAPNPELENQTPMALLLSGKGAVVTELLEDVLFGQPS